CIAHMRAHGLERIEAQPEAMDAWVEQVNAAANATLLPLAKSSWYLGANIPGKPRVFMPYSGGMWKYRKICDEVVTDGYRGFALSRYPPQQIKRARAPLRSPRRYRAVVPPCPPPNGCARRGPVRRARR